MGKLLECAHLTRDASALLKFVRRCPNLGGKMSFLHRQFSAHAVRRAPHTLSRFTLMCDIWNGRRVAGRWSWMCCTLCSSRRPRASPS